MATAVLAVGMVIGAGTANADETCTAANGGKYTGPVSAILPGDICDPAAILDNTLTAVTDPTTESSPTTEPSSATPDPTTAPVVVAPLPSLPPLPVVNPPANGPVQQPGQNPTTPGANTTPGAGAATPVALPAATMATAGAAVAAPAGSLTGGLLDLTTAPYAPALMASGVYDPSLLLGPGAPSLALATPGPASAVTTGSQIQAMALALPKGLGIPGVIGVVILAGLGGLVLRHRLLRRVKNAATS